MKLAREVMSVAHKLAKQIKKEYPNVDYRTQVGINISYLLKEANKENKEMKLMKLIGSEKQIKWAESIRKKLINEKDFIISILRNKKIAKRFEPKLSRQLKRYNLDDSVGLEGLICELDNRIALISESEQASSIIDAGKEITRQNFVENIKKYLDKIASDPSTLNGVDVEQYRNAYADHIVTEIIYYLSELLSAEITVFDKTLGRTQYIKFRKYNPENHEII